MRPGREEQAAALAGLAASQHGVLAHRQLIGLGFSVEQIKRLVRGRWLHRIHRGIYAVGHPRLTREGRYMAAVLACGEGAVLSHWSAAALWGILEPREPLVAVSAPKHRRAHRGVRAHWVPELHPRDRTIRDGIPVTTVPRTLLDLAALGRPRLLRRATNQADRLGWLNPRSIGDICERHRGRKGMAAFRQATAQLTPQTRRTRSDLEIAFVALCRRFRLPEPVMNAKVQGYEVDAYFPKAKLIVELDGYEYHRTAIEFDSDRRRDAALKLTDHEVLRVSDEWLAADPAGVAETVRRLIERQLIWLAAGGPVEAAGG